MSKYDKRLGALYGIALGDAMGMPSEGMHIDDIREKYGFIDCFYPAPDTLPKWMEDLGKKPESCFREK